MYNKGFVGLGNVERVDIRQMEIEQVNFVISSELQKFFDEKIFEKYLSKLVVESVGINEIVFSVPNKFIRDLIGKEYFFPKNYINSDGAIVNQDGIKKILSNIFPEITSCRIIANSDHGNYNNSEIRNNSQAKITNNVRSISKYNNIFTQDVSLNENFTFENYVVGKANHFAYNMALDVASDRKYTGESNMLFFYSEIGFGKTHLMQSIAWKIKNSNPKCNILYISAEKFMDQFIMATKSNDVLSFKDRFRNIDMLLIDDMQFIASGKKAATQKEMIGVFDYLISNNKKIVIACNKNVNQLQEVDYHLLSKISGGIIAEIEKPDYQLRLDIIKKKLKIVEIEFPEIVVDFIAKIDDLSIRDIEGIIRKIVAYNSVSNYEINIENIKKLINRDLIRYQKIITIDDVYREVSKYYNLMEEDLASSFGNSAFNTKSRHVAMYLSDKLTKSSLVDIGRKFGNRNHSSVIAAVQKIKMKICSANKNSEDEILIVDINKIESNILNL